MSHSFREKCRIRQCPRVNPKYSNRWLNNETSNDASIESILNYQLEETADASGAFEIQKVSAHIVSLMEEVIDRALSSSNLNPQTSSSQNFKHNERRPKVYPCPRCNKLFAQLSSANKHCSRTRAVKSCVCEKCNITLLKKNLKNHMKSCNISRSLLQLYWC